MQQAWIIHGGDTFDTYKDYLESLKNFTVTLDDVRRSGWKSSLAEALGPDFDVLAPRMPNGYNAKYVEWKIWFDKYVPFMTDPVILIGHSLGGLFLAKYLAENILPHPIRATILLAPPYESTTEYSLADFTLPNSLTQFSQQSQQIFLYHSEDDPVVPFNDANKYAAALPSAIVRTFTDRQHFNQPEFPELIAEIQSL